MTSVALAPAHTSAHSDAPSTQASPGFEESIARTEEILRWAVAAFAPRITFATGFGVEGCVLIDQIARRGLTVDLFTLDTGLLFPETYALWGSLERRYGVTIRAVRPRLSVEEQAKAEGDALWIWSPDRCCELRKLAPLREALLPFDAWLTAIRADQSEERRNALVSSWDARHGLVKVNPMLHWSWEDVWDYVRAHDVPHNPLHHRGYPSIGCFPCTSPVRPGEALRAGRWRGREKTECGIHIGAGNGSASTSRGERQ